MLIPEVGKNGLVTNVQGLLYYVVVPNSPMKAGGIADQVILE